MQAKVFRIWFFLSAILAAQFCNAATRHYYLAAEDATWDYAPSKRDLIHGAHLPMPWSQQTQWPKTRFIEYTDSTFSVRKPQPEWLGLLGPVIRAEVGDTIVVEFLNRSIRVHDIHPHGLRYDKSSEGAHYVAAGPDRWCSREPVTHTPGWPMKEAAPVPQTPAPLSGGTTLIPTNLLKPMRD